LHPTGLGVKCGQFTKGKGIEWSVDLTEELIDGTCHESGETDVRQMQEKFIAKGKKLYFGLWFCKKLLIDFREK